MRNCNNCGAPLINCAFCTNYSEFEERKVKTMNFKVKKIDPRATMPKYATVDSAGADLYAIDTVTIPSHSTVMVHTGLSIEPENNSCVILIYARSGLACKHGINLANGVGVVDSDYRGEIIVALHNNSGNNYTIYEGDRIAQMVVQPVVRAEFEEVEELETTERGAGGFGSTGRK